jgi:tRNA_anti-like
MRLSLLVTCAALFVFGCGKDKPDSGGPAPGPTGGPGPSAGVDLATAKPDHTATAAEWHAEFKKDSAGSKKKYAGKVVELTGTLASFAENPDAGVLFAHLKIEKDVLGVRCGMSDANAWEKACQGAEVTVRGKLADGAIFHGELMPAIIVKADKNPALTATAADLGKQFKADTEKLREKFGDKWVYVEGEVVSTGKSSVGGPQFTLKGDGGVNVVCSVPADNKAKVEALKPGQKVKALGEFSSPFPNDKELSLNMVMFKSL